MKEGYRLAITALFPPILGASSFCAYDLLLDGKNFNFITFLGTIGLYSFFGIIYTLIPSLLCYLSLDYLYDRSIKVRKYRVIYSMVGLLFGAAAGLLLNAVIASGNISFWLLGMGSLVGLITAAIIYPQEPKVQP
jgi:hypothetical protein